MEPKKVNSPPWTLTAWDWLKTAVVTVAMGIGMALQEAIKPILQNPDAPIALPNVKHVIAIAALGAIATIFQRLITNSDGKIAPEPPRPGSDNPNK